MNVTYLKMSTQQNRKQKTQDFSGLPPCHKSEVRTQTKEMVEIGLQRENIAQLMKSRYVYLHREFVLVYK